MLDPQTDPVRTGLRVDVRCAPAPGGLWVALAQHDAVLLGVRETELRLRTQLSGESSFEEIALARVLQAADVLNSSVGFNAFLPEGKALVVQTAFGLETGRGSALLVKFNAALMRGGHPSAAHVTRDLLALFQVNPVDDVPANASASAIEAAIAQRQSANESILGMSKALLNPAQLAVFRAQLDAELQSLEARRRNL